MPVYPGAEFLMAYDAGRNQKYYLFGSNTPFADIVSYYRTTLKQRGELKDGHVADVVVFDPETVKSNATYDEPRQFPDGIEHVIVNGTLVVDSGAHTGATPGRALRRGRD